MLIDAAIDEGGVTLDPKTGHRPDSGYMVGGVVPTLVLPRSHRAIAGSAVTREAIVEWLTEHSAVAEYVGSWYGHDAAIYIDVSTRHDDESVAHELSLERDEFAYYDIGKGESIYV